MATLSVFAPMFDLEKSNTPSLTIIHFSPSLSSTFQIGFSNATQLSLIGLYCAPVSQRLSILDSSAQCNFSPNHSRVIAHS